MSDKWNPSSLIRRVYDQEAHLDPSYELSLGHWFVIGVDISPSLAVQDTQQFCHKYTMAEAEPSQPERVLKTELHQYSRRRGTEGPYADDLDIDVLIVGAGFGGVFLLHEMRKAGYKTVLYDAGTFLD